MVPKKEKVSGKAQPEVSAERDSAHEAVPDTLSITNDLRAILAQSASEGSTSAYRALSSIVQKRGLDENGKLSSENIVDDEECSSALHLLFSQEVNSDTRWSYWHYTRGVSANAKRIGTDPGDQADYSRHWFSLTNAQEKSLATHVRGTIFLDLGGGLPGPEGTNMQKLAEQQGYAWYINEEPALLGFEGGGGVEPWRSYNDVTDVVQPKHMQVNYCDSDVFATLISLPDNCEGVTFALNGIDDIILPDDTYHKDIAGLLWKKVPPGGLVLTCGSTATDHFEDLGFTLVEGFEKSWNNVELWMKPKAA